MNWKPDFFFKPIQYGANKLKFVPQKLFQDGIKHPYPVVRLALGKTNRLDPVIFNWLSSPLTVSCQYLTAVSSPSTKTLRHDDGLDIISMEKFTKFL